MTEHGGHVRLVRIWRSAPFRLSFDDYDEMMEVAMGLLHHMAKARMENFPDSHIEQAETRKRPCGKIRIVAR